MSNISDFKNRHKGRRGIVIGNGPSILTHDLSKLKNEVTIGMNGVYNLFDKVLPMYYCIEDRRRLKQTLTRVNGLPAGMIRFIPEDMVDSLKPSGNIVVVKFIRERFDKLGVEPKFSNDASLIVFWGCSVTYMAIQLLAYMGCNPIYLMGLDGVRKGIQKHVYGTEKVVENQANYVASDAAFRKARKHLEGRSICVVDLTPDPVKRFFEYQKFEEIFA